MANLPVSGYSVTSQVVSLVFSSAHGLEVGDYISVRGVASAVNGQHFITAIPSSVTASYVVSGASSQVATNTPSAYALTTTVNTNGRPAYMYKESEDTWYQISGKVNTSGNYTWTGTHLFEVPVTISDALNIQDGYIFIKNSASAVSASATGGGLLFVQDGNLKYKNPNNEIATLAASSISGVVSITGTANEVTVSASVGEVTLSLPATINANTTGTAASLVASTFSVTSGGGVFIVDSVSQPVLNLVRGNTYVFNINAAGHPFYLQTSSLSYSAGLVYSNGVTGNNTSSITFQVPYNAPDTLTYVCGNHSNMGNTINISGTAYISQTGASGTIDFSNATVTGLKSIPNTVSSTTYTLVSADSYQTIVTTSASAVTITVPPESSVPFPIGTGVSILQTGAGQVIIAPGSGVTINTIGNSGALKNRYQYALCGIYKYSTNIWVAVGDLVV